MTIKSVGYREPEERPKRRLELRATITRPRWWILGPLVFAMLFVPFCFMATHVEVSCLAVSQTCQIDVQRVFGARHDLVAADMRGVTDVHFTGSRKNEHLEVVSQKGTQQFPSNYGGGRDLVLTVLKRFAADQTVDIEGSHGLDFLPIAFLGFGVITFVGILFAMIARIRIVAENDDVQMILRIARWPFPPRVLIFGVEDLVGAEARHEVRLLQRGQRENYSTIDLVLRGGREDLFPAALPDRSEVDEVARKLDLFVRFGQIEDPIASTGNPQLGS